MLEIEQYVLAHYKTGLYIGQIQDRTSSKIVVQVLAVVQHPEQGDLHHPQDGGVPFFHQRRALAYREMALIQEHQLQPYDGDVPAYGRSLEQALKLERERMVAHPNRLWADRAIAELQQLDSEYSQQKLYQR